AEKGGGSQQLTFKKSEVTIGRLAGNDIVLGKGNVSKYHSRIVLKEGKFIIVDMKSTNGTYVNGKKIAAPQVVRPSDKIYIGDYIINVEAPAEGDEGDEGEERDHDAEAHGDEDLSSDDEGGDEEQRDDEDQPDDELQDEDDDGASPDKGHMPAS